MTDIVKFGVIEAPHLKQYEIQNYNGTTFYVNFANEIRLISEILHLRYDLIPAEGGEFGYKQADGSFSGMLGMAIRSEVDAVLYPMEILTYLPELFLWDHSYPYGITDITFMTNKPEPVPKTFSIVHPFPYTMWIALSMILIVLPFIFYVLLNKKVKYQTILFDAFGTLLEQSFNFEVKRSRTRILSVGWLLGVMIISYGYKAVLLSALSIPRTTVIRDIPDLGRAAAEGSVECFTSVGSDLRYFTNSTISSWREIGACLKRHRDGHFRNAIFQKFKSKKVFISSRRGLSFDDNAFYISEDSFQIQLYSFLLSKDFCCSKKFNKLLNQLKAAGLDKKFEDEEKFFWQDYVKKDLSTEESSTSTSSRKILLNDISGAFLILMSGLILAFLTLVGEIFTKKYITGRK